MPHPELLIDWFKQKKRDLPWRKNRTPYSVWVSEMMLQQTQVSVVIPYFERWMKAFPTIQALAEASLNEVLKVWEGLGYYSRARYLHEGARYLAEKNGGHFPNQFEEIRKIKGLGPYTAGAIYSFAFHQKMAAVDANVIRVLARFFSIEEDISKQKTVLLIRELADKILPDREPWIFNEALIELGALLCTRQPQCQQCPLNKGCQAFLKGTVDKIPVKSKKIKTQQLNRVVAVIHWKGRFLVRRCEKGELMQDLYEFPYFEHQLSQIDEKFIQEKVKNHFGLSLKLEGTLPIVTHSFTRFQAKLTPVKFICKSKIEPVVEGFVWLTHAELIKLPFSSGHRRILLSLN
jgi:A/G-specific adenine glycosylase